MELTEKEFLALPGVDEALTEAASKVENAPFTKEHLNLCEGEARSLGRTAWMMGYVTAKLRGPR